MPGEKKKKEVKSEALSCYNCTDLSCASPGKQTCSSSEPMCITASSQVSGEQLIYKGCESSSVCLSSGHSTLSLSTRQMTVSALCCNTSDCNNWLSLLLQCQTLCSVSPVPSRTAARRSAAQERRVSASHQP
ncbi:phospholipase A2 inhibitor and Ly6/PLAUR domain-containing protein-like isoform X2 [Poeciliopsis prolifica]|uniref:phospholipase A2 inhibitor and Ly6/PLAUR domain-containing protein-like isoform X2 n=1 Tax=Poeciliopsis prolifica TaxID=188132 RepID=UPI002413589E|nr:phospholipase A2 inhibitor and Ly6/PLAUR domain-containing protein-like isoform X2 [Poeciliopsis prolifica]